MDVIPKVVSCFSRVRAAMLCLVALSLWTPAVLAASLESLADSYLSHWADFYPTRAFAQGRVEAADRFEDYSPDRLKRWLEFNDRVKRELASLDKPQTADAMVDAAILRKQIAAEYRRWREDRPLQSEPAWYADQISQALTYLLVSDALPVQDKREAVLARLAGIRRLAEQGRSQLLEGQLLRSQSALRSLRSSAAFFAEALPDIPLFDDWASASERQRIEQAAEATRRSVLTLSEHIEKRILAAAKRSPALGAERYRALLDWRSDGRLEPGKLAQSALEEVDRVRGLMLDVALQWWRSQPDKDGVAVPPDDDLLKFALAAMEDDRAHTQEAFVEQFTALTAAAETFLREHELATLAEPTTLYIASSPAHFAGAAVGGVYPAGPWSPESDTLFYLPSIGEDAPAEVAEGFYRSFNRHFNTMIISHEMFPGHYLQYKVAVNSAAPLRAVFADGAYVEGWGSFSEELMLNAGWGGNEPLTWLAHYRKRLENATRSYVSVMVHTQAWEQREVADFAVRRGLLAPQFALNLWQRVVHSPMQLTDYFVGYWQFKELWQEQRQAMGEKFDQRRLVDAVLRAGPVPVPDLSRLLSSPASEARGLADKASS